MSIDIVPADVMPVRRGGRFQTVVVSATLILVAASVAGCSKKVARTSDPRPVRTVTVESQADGETVSFTGQIRAQDTVNLAFRLDGRMIDFDALVQGFHEHLALIPLRPTQSWRGGFWSGRCHERAVAVGFGWIGEQARLEVSGRLTIVHRGPILEDVCS